MTVYTSAANGNWSSSATWGGAGVPGNADAAVVNHAVLVDVNTTVGTSPGSCLQGSTSAAVTQTLAAILINGNGGNDGSWTTQTVTNNPGTANASGVLTLATGVTLTARGDIMCNTGSLVMSAGSHLLFDTSTSTAGTMYLLETVNNYNRYGGFLQTNGTSGSRCSVSGTAPGSWRVSAGWRYIGYEGLNAESGIVRANYTDFSNGGQRASVLNANLAVNAWAGGANGNVVITGGTPTVALSNGATATYASGSGSTTLQFSYNGRSVTGNAALRMAPAGISPNGATFKDSNGHTVAMVLSYTVSQDSGTHVVSLAVTFSATVLAVTTPQMILSNGMACAYASGSGTATLTFTYAATGAVSLTGVYLDNFSSSASGSITDSSSYPLPQSSSTGLWLNSISSSTDAWNFISARCQQQTGGTANIFYLRNCTVSNCTRIAGTSGSGMVFGGYSVNFDDTIFTNGLDNQTISGQTGYGVTDSGCDIWLQNASPWQTGDVWRTLRCYFGRAVVFGIDNWTSQNCVYAAGWIALSSSTGTNRLHDSNVDRSVPGYVAGGSPTMIGYTSTYSNNIFVSDNASLVNCHGGPVFQNGTGVAALINNIIDFQNTGGGFSQICIGGNWTITDAASSGTAYSDSNTTGNLYSITGNIVTADYNSTNEVTNAAFTTGYRPGGVITQDANYASVNFAVKVENNFLPIPYGIGAIDPNEVGGGPVGTFYSIRNNIFYRPAYAQSGNGTGHAVWYRADGTIYRDDVAATMLDYNCVFGGSADTSYAGVSVASISGAPNGSTGTTYTSPGYANVLTSSTTHVGLHDSHADPLLADPNRSTVKFDKVYSGNATGSVANLFAQLLVCAQTGVFYGHSGYTIDTAINLVRTWIKAGFSPTNPTMIRRGYNATSLGAVSVNAPYISLIMV